MKELEQFIRSHAEEFDVREPSRGHEERFLARLAGAEQPARRPWRIVWSAVALAACLSALFLVTSLRRNSPEAIYLAYMEEVSELYSACPEDADADWDEALSSLTDESVPLFLQLPEELSRFEKARILREHYASLLEGAKTLVNQ